MVAHNVSLLYVPGDDPSKLRGSLGRHADAIIVDLEDAVAASSLDAAREVAAGFFDELTDTHPSGAPDVYLRVNAGEAGIDDIGLVWRPIVRCVVAPKASAGRELAGLHRALERAEARAGLTSGTTCVMPMIETASGVERLDEVCAAERVTQLQIGEVDLAADLGIFDADAAHDVFTFVRSAVVLKSRHFGLEAPVAPVDIHYRDPDRFEAVTARLLASGFGSRACIHPNQVAVVNTIVRRWGAERAAAEALIESYEAAALHGRGAIVGPDGEMVDEAVVKLARKRLERR